MADAPVATETEPAPLKFKVAPHIVEDLGLNLYTSLPRVLVEFVANAYDADSPNARITFDKDAIDQARKIVRKRYELERAESEKTGESVPPLASRTLPEDLKITIEDEGHGMSRGDLDTKFLFAGRRRRDEEPESKGRSPEGRPLMGRKGLGKLAGFGVAKHIEVVTRKAGETHATRILLDYDELIKKKHAHEIDVPEKRLEDGGGFAESGTRIVLSHLLYDPVKSRTRTIENEISEYFAFIEKDDFVMLINTKPLDPPQPDFAYAWPEPDLSCDQLVEMALPREEGGDIRFSYRIRFRGKNDALPATRRGVRVYSNKRLAAAPSLLGADTNMHGFRMTDYMDGIVRADFVDEEKTDYISTDRETLRWESPLLSRLYDFVSNEIKEACKNYQKKRDEEAKTLIQQDSFTMAEIGGHEFTKRDRRMALRFAAILEGACKRGVDDPLYKGKLPFLLQGIGQGNILASISKLAEQDHPDLGKVAVEVARLTKDELDTFISWAKVRIKAIEALKKIVRDVDFREKKQEKIVQELFEESPWLVDSTYTQVLSGDKDFREVFVRLAKELKIGGYAPPNAKEEDERPDLVFLIGNIGLRRLVVVELKAANLYLEDKHLTQLYDYMATAEQWLKEHGYGNIKVHGQLIGSKSPAKSRARGVVALRRRIERAGPQADWTARDYLEVLEDTEAAHNELLEAHRHAAAADADADEEPEETSRR